MPPTATPPKSPPKVGGVIDALERLESRRRRGGEPRRKPAGRRGDLDLDAIP